LASQLASAAIIYGCQRDVDVGRSDVATRPKTLLVARVKYVGPTARDDYVSARLKTLRGIAIPCEAAGQEPEVCDEDPGLGAGDGSLGVLCEPAAAAEPGEGQLNHPSSRQDFEALRMIGALDDLEGPSSNLAEAPLEFLAAISAIGEDVTQPGIAVANGVQHLDGTVPILDIGAVDDEPDQTAECVRQDVSLAALDLLASVEAPDAAAFGGLDALAVDDASGRTGLPAFQFARRGDEMVADRLQKAAVAPIVEIALDRGVEREILGQQRPRAAARGQIQDRVHDLPQVRRPRTTERLRLRQERGN
jgi:hypothetical protein